MASINALVNAKLDKDGNSAPPDCTGNVDSLATYVGIVPGLVQRPNALNAKNIITGHKTVKAPSGSHSWCMKVSGVPWFAMVKGELVLIL